MRFSWFALLALIAAAEATGCGDGGASDRDSGADTDTDSDSDTDSDTSGDPCAYLTTPTCALTPTDSCPGPCAESIWPGGIIIAAPEDLAQLTGVTAIAGSLSLECSTCPSFQGLECLEQVAGELWISGNDLVADMTGFYCLTEVGGHLTVFDNPGLTSLAGLGRLAHVGGHFDIGDNGSLESLAGLEALTAVDVHLRITGNTSLERICGVTNLEWIGDGLNIEENGRIYNLDGLESFTGGSEYTSIEISDNPSLINLFGLGPIASANMIAINGNPMLRYLDGLESLEQVTGPFWIGGNFHLKSIAALGSLAAVGDYSAIGANPHLPECAVEELNAQLSSGSFASSGNDADGGCGDDWVDDEADCVFDTDVCHDGDTACADDWVQLCTAGAWHDDHDCAELGMICLDGSCAPYDTEG